MKKQINLVVHLNLTTNVGILETQQSTILPAAPKIIHVVWVKVVVPPTQTAWIIWNVEQITVESQKDQTQDVAALHGIDQVLI